jgi:hypothetical protein
MIDRIYFPSHRQPLPRILLLLAPYLGSIHGRNQSLSAENYLSLGTHCESLRIQIPATPDSSVYWQRGFQIVPRMGEVGFQFPLRVDYTPRRNPIISREQRHTPSILIHLV